MPEPRRDPGHETDLSRRDFLARRLPQLDCRAVRRWGGGRPGADDGGGRPIRRCRLLLPRDLTRISRDGVKAALARIRAQRRGP